MEASTFVRLSPELRNLVYHHVFTTDYAVTLKTNGIQHPLTLTCRQIRRETLRMYLSLTTFNAHLDDGPTTPLAHWLQTIGAEMCLLLREVRIWDMHTLNATLRGTESTERMLTGEKAEDGGTYVLRPVGRQFFYKSWFLKDINLPLRSLGLGLERICILRDDGSLKQTSQFALLPITSPPAVVDGCAAMAEEFGLSEAEQTSLARQLGQGREEIRLLDGRRHVILKFDAQRRLVSMRQEFIARDEEFYL